VLIRSYLCVYSIFVLRVLLYHCNIGGGGLVGLKPDLDDQLPSVL